MLSGALRLVLQACNAMQGESDRTISDSAIAQETRLRLSEVRDCIESLNDQGYLQTVRLIDGLTVRITAEGRLFLSQRRRFPDETGGEEAKRRAIKVVPKGLLAFDAADKDDYLELLPDYAGFGELPGSISYWKTRIEQTDPNQAFKVGIIYGPSGCGKTSLVKAGLLPRLSSNILTVMLDATPDGTEGRLLRSIRAKCPELPADLGLVESLACIQSRGALPPGKKLLLVLDQFEQWLLANRGRESTELVSALRQCDGSRLQAIIMVRDEYFGPTESLQKELGIEFRWTMNSLRVQPFTPPHATKVLAAFGRGSGRLDESLTLEQKAFIEEAVQGLAVGGTVIPVRLALFAQMFSGREWSPKVLREIGGPEGVGVAFLEDTFASHYADPRLKRHLEAVQSILKALLPEESGADIKRRRSHTELLTASGYSDHPATFESLLKILDNELRLITPIDPEELSGNGQTDRQSQNEAYYQLTHDYLVPSVREWLYQKKRTTRPGRAELRLSGLSNAWNKEPDNRHLPSLSESLEILRWTDRKNWTEPHRKMMSRARHVHGVVVLVALLVLSGATMGGLVIRGRVIEDEQATDAAGLVKALLHAEIEDVPEIITDMKDRRPLVDRRLREEYQKAAATSHQRLCLSLALLPVDGGQVDFLSDRMLAANSSELPILRDALSGYRTQLMPKLWSVLASSKPNDPRLLPAASAMAVYDGTSPRWAEVRDNLVQALVSVHHPIELSDWLTYLKAVHRELMPPLAAIFRNRRRSDSERFQAANILCVFADAELLADLLMDADDKSFSVLISGVRRNPAQAVPILEAEVVKSGRSSWNDPPLARSWTEPDPALGRRIEAADGVLAERFAFCQTMDLGEFRGVAERLGESGYRPIRLRPYADGTKTRAAAVWSRDGRNWQLALDLSAEAIRKRDTELRALKLIPQDVAGYVACSSGGEKTDRYAALWVERASPADEARMYVAAVDADHKALTDDLKKGDFVARSIQATRSAGGQTNFCGVWGRSEPDAIWNEFWNQTESLYELNGGRLLDQVQFDACVSEAPEPPSARERAARELQAAEETLRSQPDHFQSRIRRAKANLRLGNNQKAVAELNLLIENAPESAALYAYRAIAHARSAQREKAMNDLTAFQKRTQADPIKLCIEVAVTAALGEEAEPLKRMETLLDKKRDVPNSLYFAAWAYAVASQGSARSEADRSAAYCHRAVALLEEAFNSGQANLDLVESNEFLDFIRERPEFKAMLQSVKLDRRYTSLWQVNAARTWVESHGLDPVEHLRQCREWLAQGYRMVSISVARTSAARPLVSTSVWQRPLIAADERERLARRQAQAAVALVLLGQPEKVWPLLRHTRNPTARTMVVSGLQKLGASPLPALKQLMGAAPHRGNGPEPTVSRMDSILFDPDLSQRRALILALGTYEIGEIPQSDRQPIIETLLAEFRNHPDAGVHGAAEWTLRRWGLDREVERAEVDLQQADGTGKRWFVTKSGSTMISIHGRVSVSMGSPRDETGHTPAESRPYQNLITRRFALAAKELTRSQFQQFLADRSLQGDETDEYPGGPDAPQIALNWFRAAEYCDWLSQREGLQPCYRPNAEGYYGVGMGIRPDFLDRNGYRMPTVAEWEYACRAGTTTAWYCGDAVEQLGGYAWHEGNSAIRIHPVGRLKPNDLGFFDIHGNASEWTSDPPFYHHPAVDAPPALDTWYFMINDQGDRRLRKGGCAESRAVAARSALAESYQSSNNYKLSGLRIARTLK